MNIKNLLRTASMLIAAFALCACSNEDEVKKLITFHTGAERENTMSNNRVLEIMPVSGTTIYVNKNQFMYNGDLQKVVIADSQPLPDGSRIRGFYFFCNSRGAKLLFQASAGNMGGYIVLKYDGISMAARKVDMAMNDGKIFLVPEVNTNDDLQKIADEMNKAIKTVEEIKKRQDSDW